MISPYVVKLKIKGAKNVPIADITSSDPYLIISKVSRDEDFVAISLNFNKNDKQLDELKYIGRTKTVRRNRNPVWNEDFEINLLHRDKTILLSLFDEDKNKSDFIGYAIIRLSDFECDTLNEEITQVIFSAEFAKSRECIVNYELVVQRNYHMINVTDTEPENYSPRLTDFMKESLDDMVEEYSVVLPTAVIDVSLIIYFWEYLYNL